MYMLNIMHEIPITRKNVPELIWKNLEFGENNSCKTAKNHI